MSKKASTKQKRISRLKETAKGRMEQKMYMRNRVGEERVKRKQLK
jgi:hypothetical protein